VWLAAGSLLAGEWRTLAIGRISPASAGALAYLVVFGSIVAFTAYVWLMRRVAASTVSTHAYVNPIVAVAFGAALGAERVHPTTIAAALTIAAGVMLALLDRSSRPIQERPTREPSTREPLTGETLTGEQYANTDSTGRSDRDGRRSVRGEGVARPDVARLPAWRHRAPGVLAPPLAAAGTTDPIASQHLGDHGARGVLEVRGTPADHRRETGIVCLERQ
jgi:hypothetical protein